MSVLNQVLLHPDQRVGADFAAWRVAGGGAGLRVALRAEPARIIAMIRDAGLRGLGGSGYPTHRKWQHLVEQQEVRERYLIVNGNEDEPGTFKDRLLHAETPHQVIEGAAICAVACNINHIVFYINPDQTVALDAMRDAVAQWRDSDLLDALTERLGRGIELRVMASSGHYMGARRPLPSSPWRASFPFPGANRRIQRNPGSTAFQPW